MGLATVQRQAFHRAMRRDQDGAAGCFVDAAAFHADEAVLDQVEAADPVGAAQMVEAGQARVAGDNFSPSMATASPAWKDTST